MRARLLNALAVLLFLAPALPAAAACAEGPQTYTVKRGDTLSGIAQRVYGDYRKWTVIHNANVEAIGVNPHLIRIGARFRVPCLETRTGTTAWTPAAGKQVRLLTASDYKPFTDESLDGGGLITKIVEAALADNPDIESHGIARVNDWSQHLDALLLKKEFDVGFPWLKPRCEENPSRFRCRNFHFSEPLFEMLVMLYVRKDAPLRFESDADIVGVRLCRPKGYYIHDLDRAGRAWVSGGKIDLVRAPDPAACFRMLARQEVDGVTINEFTGRLKIHELGLQGTVVAAPRPVSIEGLHVIIAKTHPRGTTFLYRFNAGLERLKESERYDEVIDRHLSAYWGRLEQATATPVEPEPVEPEPVEPEPEEPEPEATEKPEPDTAGGQERGDEPEVAVKPPTAWRPPPGRSHRPGSPARAWRRGSATTTACSGWTPRSSRATAAARSSTRTATSSASPSARSARRPCWRSSTRSPRT